MKNKSIIGMVISLIFFICLIQTVPALTISHVPGLTGLVVSSTSGSDVSSSLSISSSTNIVSSSPPSSGPSTVQKNTGMTENPPGQWQPGVREGVYYDPLSKTSWVYDRILRKFYCPEKGWLLIGQYSTTNPPKLLMQYYYDPKNTVLIDMKTGKAINIDQTASYDPSSVTPEQTPMPQTTSSSTVIMMASTPGQTSDPCLVPCSDCPGGSCQDCDHNGICDNGEGTQTSQSTTQSTGGISEAPQTEVLPDMIEIPGCTFVKCPTCFGKVCYDCNSDGVCDDPQPNLSGKNI